MRRELGLPRHPAQIVVSERGNIDLSSRVFSTPDVPVFLLAGERVYREDRRGSAAAAMDHDDSNRRRSPGRDAADFGASTACRGFRAWAAATLATSLVDAGLVQDIYLTTSAIEAGEPGTPWYTGPVAPPLRLIVSKREDVAEAPIQVEHLAIG